MPIPSCFRPLSNAFAAIGHDCDGWWWPTVSPVWRMADSVRLPRYRTISDEWLHKLFLTLNHPIECGDSTQWLIRCPLPPLLPWYQHQPRQHSVWGHGTQDIYTTYTVYIFVALIFACEAYL